MCGASLRCWIPVSVALPLCLRIARSPTGLKKGFDHFEIALSIGVQHMVRSDLSSSGVMFTIDTESGFKDAILINAAYGLGESIVQGSVNPDEYYVFKPTLKTGHEPIL